MSLQRDQYNAYKTELPLSSGACLRQIKLTMFFPDSGRHEMGDLAKWNESDGHILFSDKAKIKTATCVNPDTSLFFLGRSVYAKVGHSHSDNQ